MSGAKRLAQPDLTSAFGDGDEHDVDDADGAESKRNHTDHPRK